MSEDCYHCGDKIPGRGIHFDDKDFCCIGCKNVYQLLSNSALGQFYQLEKGAGQKPQAGTLEKYAFLEVEKIREKHIDFEDDTHARVTLFLPQIHCSSCIYLLENISRIDNRIRSCQVNFAKREAVINFNNEIKLSELAHLLEQIGYAPNFGDRKTTEKKKDRSALYKLGFAGFAFGSIMLWSFPEYLGVEKDNPEFRAFTSYLSLVVSLPVFFYSASDYFISAYKALKYKNLNLDVPITIGILALYCQSLYSIFVNAGPGYMDSFAGFIFFLLIGKWFQGKTYQSLSFERDYKAYFPVAVTRKLPNSEEIVEIEDIHVDDLLLIRNDEVIPCDCILESKHARIDYSFVTGESEHIAKKKGDFIYAGGKLIGQRTALKVVKESDRSHLTSLWNEVRSEKENSGRSSYQDKMSVYFLAALLIIAAVASVTWFFIDASRVMEIAVAVLIVACPCALALSAPFTYGNTMRLLGRKGLYLKNTSVIECLNTVTDIVFDKTGTLTSSSQYHVDYEGDDLSEQEKMAISSLANSSTHPLSRSIVRYFMEQQLMPSNDISDFEEITGKGLLGTFDGSTVQLGSSSFVGSSSNENNESSSHVRVGNKSGVFRFSSELRQGIEQLPKSLDRYALHVISGDGEQDLELLKRIFPEGTQIHFRQTPEDKFRYIKALHTAYKKVLMIGDGLNDSGALGAADVGIAVSEEAFRFTPSSDAIIDAGSLTALKPLLDTSAFSKTILRVCLTFSLAYNFTGLSFALTGMLTPLVAAIIMPLSSITIVCISTFGVLLYGRYSRH
jgi:Cu+-exporting ATPase